LVVRFAAALLFCLAFCGQADARQVCAWLVETAKPGGSHDLDVWMQADTRIDFLYQIGGRDITGEGFRAHSPGSGTFVLDPGKPTKVWGFGATMPSPGKIDISVELHRTPKDIFSKEATPLIAGFSFARDVPARETRVPPILARKQCKTVT